MGTTTKAMLSLASMLLLLILSLSPSSVDAHFKWEENACKSKSIFILAGQSNMAGRAFINEAQPPPEFQPENSILRLSAKLAWELARDPLHKDIDVSKTNRAGPAIPFAKKVLAEYPNEVLGFVPCAIGGTELSQWAQGQELYKNMIARAKAAVGLGGGKIEALLWFQGESDTDTLEEAQAYKCKFEKFIADVRADLGLPSLKVVMAVVGTVDNKTKINNLKAVRDSQFAIELKDFKRVDSLNLPLFDGVHLNAEGEIKIGQMFAGAYLELKKCSPAAEVSGHLEAFAGASATIGGSPLTEEAPLTEAVAGAVVGKGEAAVSGSSKGSGGY